MFTFSNSKLLFTAGVFSSFSIERTIGGWLVYLSGTQSGWIVDARTKQPRVFKSVDSCITSLSTIGFTVNKIVMR